VFDGFAAALDHDEKVMLPNFGTFATRRKEERVRRNPKTGEPAVIAARKVVSFNVAHRMKAKVAFRS
jgi:nucleoid DNA-binding protein